MTEYWREKVALCESLEGGFTESVKHLRKKIFSSDQVRDSYITEALQMEVEILRRMELGCIPATPRIRQCMKDAVQELCAALSVFISDKQEAEPPV